MDHKNEMALFSKMTGEVTKDPIKLEQEDEFAAVGPDDTFIRCQTCLRDNQDKMLRDMKQTHLYEGISEVYSDMIEYCFTLQIGKNDQRLESVYLICESCIKRLRDAVDFKHQIEGSQENIQHILSKQLHSETSYLGWAKFDYPHDSDKNSDDNYDCGDVKKENELPEADDKDLKSKPIIVKKLILKREGVQKKKPDGKRKQTVIKVEAKPENVKQNILNDGEDVIPKVPVRRKPPLYVLEKSQRHCKICNESFITQKELVSHMPKHFYKHTCDYCDQKFVDVSKFLLHRDCHLPDLYLCPHCPTKRFKRHSTRVTHMKNLHSDTPIDYGCPYCSVRFLSHYQKCKHLIQVHDRTEYVNRFQCTACDQRFPTTSRRFIHFRRKHKQDKNIVCEICGKAFLFNRDLSKHMVKHTGDRNFPCTVCGKAYLRQFTLTQHMKIHTGEKKHVCEICSKSFTYKCSLKGHMASHLKESKKKNS